jgi:hypothetical protein
MGRTDVFTGSTRILSEHVRIIMPLFVSRHLKMCAQPSYSWRTHYLEVGGSSSRRSSLTAKCLPWPASTHCLPDLRLSLGRRQERSRGPLPILGINALLLRFTNAKHDSLSTPPLFLPCSPPCAITISGSPTRFISLENSPVSSRTITPDALIAWIIAAAAAPAAAILSPLPDSNVLASVVIAPRPRVVADCRCATGVAVNVQGRALCLCG